MSTDMPLEAIEHINQAEAAGRDCRQAAEAQAKQLLAEAQRSGAALLQKTREDAARQGRELLSEAEKRAAAKGEEIRAAAQAEGEALRREAQSHLEAAADLIVGRVVGD